MNNDSLKDLEELRGLKIALVHDWLVSSGGGERVLKNFHDMFPDAPIYTLVYDEKKAPSWLKDCDVRTTYIQKWPGGKSHHKLLLSFMPKAWEAIDFNEYDLVISCCSSCCKGILTSPNTLHICYSFSPTRYLWDMYYEYLNNSSFVKRKIMPRMIHKVRMWDFLAAQRPDYFVSDSDFVGKRIAKYYRRDSETVYPGVHINEYPIVDEPDDYYLVVSRFVRYKRVDLAIEACNKLGRKLIVIGSGGEEEEHLKSIAGFTIEFKGAVSDSEMEEYYSHAKAFLFPGIEDFGITPVESISAGCPVLAFGKGGALETVINKETGLFFYDQTVDGMADCILKFEREGVKLTRSEIRDKSFSFSEDMFKEKMAEFIKQKMIMGVQP